jgi:DNA polymerase III delta subunit
VREWEVPDWLGRHARERYGLQLGKPVVQALCARVGEDLGLLDGALRRLKEQIAPRRRLEVEDVEDSTEQHRSPVLFEAGNAVEAHDLKGALRAIEGAFTEGIRIRSDVVSDPRGIAPILLGNLHTAYGKLLRFHLFRRGGLAEPEAAKRAGVSPKATRFFVERARRHQLETLVERHRHFLAADLALKGAGEREEPRVALDRLVVALLSGRR